MSAVEVEGLVKRYAGRAVVDGLSFVAGEGEIFCLLGPNGAGKTTTVEILEGLRTADGGRVRVLGLDPQKDPRSLRQRIGVMPQGGRLYTRIRPVEAIRQFAAFYDDPLDPGELLRSVGLDGSAARTHYRLLSGGEQQRLSLALALIGRPELAFLDEPTAGLDAHARAATWDIIRALRDRGRTVVLTTHVLDEAERLADQVAIVHRGRLVAAGAPADLVAGDSRGLRFRAQPGLDTTAIGAAAGGSAIEDRPGEYRVTGVDASPAVVARVTAWLAERGAAIVDLVAGSRSLEEVFLELTRDEEAG